MNSKYDIIGIKKIFKNRNHTGGVNLLNELAIL